MEIGLHYPIGKYEPQPFSEKENEQWLADIKFLLTTIKSAVHTVVDSHINAYIRFKLGYIESNPAIISYEEKIRQVLPMRSTSRSIFQSHCCMLCPNAGGIYKSFNEENWQKALFHAAQISALR